MSTRNCLLKIIYLLVIILHKTDFAIFTVLPCITSWAMCLTDKYLWKKSPNKLRGNSLTPPTSKGELFVTLVNTANYFHREIFKDVAGVLDSPLKLATIKNFKRNNRKIMPKAIKNSRKIFQGTIFLGEYFRGVNFPEAILSGTFSGGFFSRGHFSRHPITNLFMRFLLSQNFCISAHVLGILGYI